MCLTEASSHHICKLYSSVHHLLAIQLLGSALGIQKQEYFLFLAECLASNKSVIAATNEATLHGDLFSERVLDRYIHAGLCALLP